MRKLCIIVTGLFCTLLFTTCKQYFADIENDLSYWSSEVTAGVVTCDQLSQTIGGAMCIPSATDAAFTLKVRNPKSFTLVTPSSPADAQNIINFPGLSPQPVYGTDYTLQQTASDTLTLTYKSGFLQRHEWGTGNIGAEITFISTDGRVFGDRFNLNIRADSAPVLESAGIGKTATPDSSGNHYYVLLFRVKEMGDMIGTQRVHKDIDGGKLIVTKDRGNPVELPLTFNPGNTDFTPGAFPLTNMELLASGAVTVLDSSDPPLPSTSAQDWILRLKTDVIVGGPEKLYEVCIKDTQGLRSALIPARTKKNKLADVELLDGSTQITGATAGNPKMFAGIGGKTLTAQAAPAGAVITGTVWRFTSAPGNWAQTDTVSGTTTAAVNLPPLAAGENQARYKISLTAALSGYEDSNPTDFYITLVRQEIPILKLKQDFSSSDNSLNCISAGAQGYVRENIIPDAPTYSTSSNPLVIYSMLSGQCKLELSASPGTTVKYQLGTHPVQSATASADITVSGGTHKLEVWAENGGMAGPKTTVYIKVADAVNSYGELKNVVKNAPEQGTGPGQHDYSSFFINIKIGADLTASADTEIAVTGGKKLMLSSSISSTVRTVNANNSGRICKVSDAGSRLDLQDIKLEGGYAADGKGGAVCVQAGGTLGLTEKTVITPSTAPDTNTRGKNDVYLATGCLINLYGLANSTPIVARITPETYAASTQVLEGAGLMASYTKFRVTQPTGSTGVVWTIKNDGKLAAISTTITGGSDAWKKLRELVQIAPASTVITINGEITAMSDPDNSGEIVIDKDLTIKGSNRTTDILNANGTAGGKSEHRIFNVEAGKTLTLEKLTIKGGKGDVGGDGGGIYAAGTLIMRDCTVTGNETAYGNGGGIFAGDALTMTRCTVDNNTVNESSGLNGGGIYAAGTLIMTDCTVDHNTAKHGGLGGGIYIDGTGSLIMTGGTVSNNQAESSGNGGGIYAAGTLTMTGCTVTTNETVNGSGGGIYATGAFTMKDCTLTGNKAQYGDGGGIYIDGTGSLTMTGGALTGNEAVNNKTGGGVYVKGTFTMKGASRITPSADNAKGKNDVYLANGKMITVDGALTGTSPIARITPASYADGTVVVQGSSSFTLPSGYAQKFVITPSINANENWTLDDSANNQLKLIDYGVFTIAASSSAGDKITLSWKNNGSGDVRTITNQPYRLMLSPYITDIKLEAECSSSTFLKEWTLTGGGTPPSGYTVEYPNSTSVKGKTITAVFAGRSTLPAGFNLSSDGKTIKKYTGTTLTTIDLNAIGLGCVEKIANDAFRKKSGGSFTDDTTIQEVVLPNSLKELSSYAFYNCKALKKVTIPSGFTGDIDEVFPGCTALEEYVIAAGNPRYCRSIQGHLCSKKKTASGSYDPNDLTLVSVVFKPSTHPILKITDGRIKEIKKMAAEFHTFTKIQISGLTALSKIYQYAFFKSGGGYEVTIDRHTPPGLPADPGSVFVGATKIKVPSGSVTAYKAAWTNYAGIIE